MLRYLHCLPAGNQFSNILFTIARAVLTSDLFYHVFVFSTLHILLLHNYVYSLHGKLSIQYFPRQ